MKKTSVFLFLWITVPGLLFAQWNPDSSVNNPVCRATLKQVNPQSAMDGQGGIITCWQDNRDGEGLYGNIYVQRLDSNGIPMWDTNGILISTDQSVSVFPKIMDDGHGGAFIAWIDHRYTNASNVEEADVYAQHIDSLGNILWQQGGVAVDSNQHAKAHISLALDNRNRLYLAWDEYNDAQSTNGIYAQHLDSMGNILWGTRSVPLPVADNFSGVDAYEPQIISDGMDGFIAVWYDNRQVDYDAVFAQRMDDTGARIWGLNDVRVCYTNQDQMYPKVTTNGSGGVIIAWQDDRANFNGFGPEYDIYAQGLDLNGNRQWLSTGVPVCVANQLQLYPQIVSDNQGGAYIAWADRRLSSFNELLYLQHLNANGDTLFQTNGIKCAEHLSYSSSLFGEENGMASMVDDVDSGLTIAWSNGNNIYAQRIDSFGNFKWDTSGRSVATANNSQLKSQLIQGNSGHVLCVWQDERAADSISSNDDIYASMIPIPASNLSIAPLENRNSLIIYPNPTTQYIYFHSFYTSNAAYINIYNENGRLIKKVEHHHLNTPLNVSGLPAGVYFIRLKTGNKDYSFSISKL